MDAILNILTLGVYDVLRPLNFQNGHFVPVLKISVAGGL